MFEYSAPPCVIRNQAGNRDLYRGLLNVTIDAEVPDLSDVPPVVLHKVLRVLMSYIALDLERALGVSHCHPSSPLAFSEPLLFEFEVDDLDRRPVLSAAPVETSLPELTEEDLAILDEEDAMVRPL